MQGATPLSMGVSHREGNLLDLHTNHYAKKDTVVLKGASSTKLYSHPLKELRLLQYVYGKSPIMETTG